MSDRLKTPPERDFGFYQRRKHDKWRAVEPPEPALEATVADSHAHVHMFDDPAWELARCAANGVDFVCEICDPSEDALNMPADLRRWREGCASGHPALQPPAMRMAAGVHPHNAKLYDERVERRLLEWLSADEAVIMGEIGLDFHYDLSPRDVQARVFRRQLRLAKELDLPVALHLRTGEDLQADDAHAQAFAILSHEGFPARGTILHCCALPPDRLKPWIEADCYIAYGGALTFKNAEEARAGAAIVPEDRLLLETDSPYMAPEPMRGAACTPAHVIFTAAHLADLLGCASGSDRERFLRRIHDNTLRILG